MDKRAKLIRTCGITMLVVSIVMVVISLVVGVGGPIYWKALQIKAQGEEDAAEGIGLVFLLLFVIVGVVVSIPVFIVGVISLIAAIQVVKAKTAEELLARRKTITFSIVMLYILAIVLMAGGIAMITGDTVVLGIIILLAGIALLVLAIVESKAFANVKKIENTPEAN